MKILFSAFAFAPNVGSEPGVGWRWAAELAVNHEVTVITDITRRVLVEAKGVELPPNIKVVYFRPAWLRAVPLNSATAPLLYTAWQFGLLGFARCLHREKSFDLAVHSTYSVFRHPSFLGFLGIPFVFGPLGGGEDAPLALKKSIHGREKVKELLRSLLNKMALCDPFLWAAYSRTSLILASTEQTRCALPWIFRKRTRVYPNLGIDARQDVQPVERVKGEPLQILFAGRLLGWKGVHLAIRALAQARNNGVDVELTILGTGPYENKLRELSTNLGADQFIRWLGHRPQQELFELYKSMHGFIFPSLHDSGGTVVLEAQMSGLPVICLDIGGPATLVTPETSIVISTGGQNEEAVVYALAEALKQLACDENQRLAMALAAVLHVRKNMNWKQRVNGMLGLLEEAKCEH